MGRSSGSKCGLAAICANVTLTGGMAIGLLSLGCQRAVESEYVLSEATRELAPELKSLVQSALEQHCGTPHAPRLLGGNPADRERLVEGAAIYRQRCQQCHGTSGDGAGPAANQLQPRPRDYRRGIFKFTSTPYGAKPHRADLVRTVRRGIYGTSMPSFATLSRDELEAVVDYVLSLTHRGELEVYLAAEADGSEELPSETVTEYVATVLDSWKSAETLTLMPATSMPPRSAETVAQGKQLFMTKGCAKCHGEDGRGMTRDNVGVDAWGHATSAADLTSGMLRGGSRAEDVYQRIFSGINGTPMPSFQQVLAGEPDTYWYLVHYVLEVSSQRRQGQLPVLSVPLTLAEVQAGAGPLGGAGAPSEAVSEERHESASELPPAPVEESSSTPTETSSGQP